MKNDFLLHFFKDDNGCETLRVIHYSLKLLIEDEDDINVGTVFLYRENPNDPFKITKMENIINLRPVYKFLKSQKIPFIEI